MAAEDWNWKLPTDLQDVPWDCAATSVAWCLRSIGLDWSEARTVAAMHPQYLSPAYGLLDASGVGLVEWLSTIGVSAEHNADATFQEVLDAAGWQPMVVGGRQWNHWVAVRMGGPCFGRPDLRPILLMNPAPGYMGVEQVLDEDWFDDLGPFSAVWFTGW